MSIATATRPHGRHAVTVPPTPAARPWGPADFIAFAAVGVVALLTRFIGLPAPVSKGTPVFDEKHYVPQAWDIVRSWDNLFIGGVESNPGYGLVVHPPLAKQITALSEFIFGYSPLGWRLMTALFGVGTILLVMAITRRLSGSWLVATFAGIIACADGALLVGSKFGMLDIYQVFFIVAASWALLHDHEQMRTRLHNAFMAGNMGTSNFGPRFGFRWWRLAAGVFLGCTLAVKWSGLYYIMFFGLLSVFSDLFLRRRYQVRRPVVGTLVRDTPAALASLVAVPVAIYAWTWRAWFASDTSVYRHAKVDGTIAADSPLQAFPEPIAGWFYYHASVLKFHSSLTSSGGHSHPWDSKPWAWLVSARPILYYSNGDATCMGGKQCKEMLYLFGTPAIWWMVIPALLWALWRLVVSRDRRFLFPLVGFAAGFFPWLAAFDRQMYFFYATAFIPFVIVIIALILGDAWNKGPEVKNKLVRALAFGQPIKRGTAAVNIYLALVVAMFVYFSPILYGFAIPNDWYDSLMWFPSWK